MALTSCRECGRQVSDQAEACPHCGIRSPGGGARPSPQPGSRFPEKKRQPGCLSVIGIIVVLGIIIAMLGSGSNNSSGPKTSGDTNSQQPNSSQTNNTSSGTSSDSQTVQGQAPAVSSCSSDWHACKDNADLVNNYVGWAEVRAACQTEVDNEVQYGEPKWPGLWSGGAFETFMTGTNYVSTGIVVAIEKDVQIENAFGAMVHSTAYCRYDLNSKEVLSAAWDPN